jgi:hypothetical protein
MFDSLKFQRSNHIGRNSKTEINTLVFLIPTLVKIRDNLSFVIHLPATCIGLIISKMCEIYDKGY